MPLGEISKFLPSYVELIFQFHWNEFDKNKKIIKMEE